MVKIENLSKVFHIGTVNENPAIRSIDLEVAEGDFITIIGSNGAGKSTLFNLITGTLPPTEGVVRINNIDVTSQSEFKRARFIGRIFQNPLLGTASNMSLEDNMMVTYRKGLPGLRVSLNAKMREFFQSHLVALDMGLEHRMKDNIGLLSGGQRQALTLLMMVLSRPSLVLLDEHTAALDPKNAQLVLDLTTRYIGEYGLTTMMITHNMNQAIAFGSRLLMMDGGEIILDVSGEDKKRLTVPKLVKKFHEIRRRSFENDEVLLSDPAER